MAKKLPPISERNWITEQELASRWGLSPRAVRDRRTKGAPMPPVARFMSQKPLRYLKADVEAFEKQVTA